MNQRLIELANKANEDIGYTFKMEDAKQLHELMEKFGELIVQDCIQLADQYGYGGAGSEFDVGYISCANTLSDEFKKRFGVKE